MIANRQRDVIGLCAWIALTAVAAVMGAIASTSAGMFYQQIARPIWAPPASVFGPVWTVLYLLMAVAAWWVWRARGLSQARGALTLYVSQLILNSLWTWLFFAWHRGDLAFADIIVLWVLLVATMIAFARIRVAAAVLLLPYALWTSFACALTYACWRLNPAILS